MELLGDLAVQAAAVEDWPVGGGEAPEAAAQAEPWCVARALEMVPEVLRDALAGAGATAPGVLRGLCAGTRADAEVLVNSLLPGLAADAHEELVSAMLWLARIAAPEAATRRRRFAHLDPGTIVQEVLEGAAAKSARVARDQIEAVVRDAEAAWRPAVRPARFRLRSDARLAAAAGPAARAEAEHHEREKWKAALVELIREAGGPVVEATRLSRDQALALAAAAGGRRARTLAKRVGAWRRVRAWCLDVYAAPFPKTVLHMIEYLQSRADEPCGLSALQGVAAGFAFMETCCGYQRGQRLVDDPLFEAYQRELVAGYTCEGGAPLKQAPRYPVALVLALEREVMDGEVAACYRCFAWWHLLALWASLRFDDHRGLPPSAVQLTVRGLEATLCRTKTTGPGKRVTSLPLVVGYGAFLSCPGWLATGWKLWQDVAPFVRDYFLVKPAANMDATLPLELTYEQASRLSRAVLAGLPREGDAMVSMAEPVVGLFTQHSARCWLASMAALLEVGEADLAFLGRWSPTTSKGYVRTATEVVMRVQETVARRLRQDFRGPVEAIAGEQAAYLELRRELIRRCHPEDVITEHLDEMQAWTAQLVGTAVLEPSFLADPVQEKPEDVDELEDAAAGDPGEHDVDEECGAASPTPPAVPVPEAEGPPQLPVSESSGGPPASGYVVSLSKSDWRRLHRIGGCARHPGVHYLRYELLGDAKPAPESYDDFCRQCWRAGGPEEESDDAESETEPDEDEAPLLVDVPLEVTLPAQFGFN